MRIAYIAVGAGSMYCGACHRDAALFRALDAAGHELLAIPLYTPLRTDRPLACETAPVFMGGISLYLAQTLAPFRHLPAVLRRQFDRPTLLRGVSRLAIPTAPAKLGRLTVSVLTGTDGPHAAEIRHLIAFLQNDFRPDIINLSNSLLASLAPAFRAALQVPIVSTLQGEESFIEALPEPYRAQSIALLRRHAASIDRFISCAQERIPALAALLAVPADRIAAIPTGIDPTPFTQQILTPTPLPHSPIPNSQFPIPSPTTLAYLSSIRPEKGLDLLIEALAQLVNTHRRPVRLAIAGQILDKPYWRKIQRQIDSANLQPHITYHGEPDLPAKVAFLHAAHLFIMPTRLPESRALAAMEALAAGLPVIASRLGVLPELLAQTAAGITFESNNPAALAAAILQLLDNPAQSAQFSAGGPAKITEHYSTQTMAQRTLALYTQLLPPPLPKT